MNLLLQHQFQMYFFFSTNFQDISISELSEGEQRKITNAQKNKSKEEKEELIERLFLENVRLKRKISNKEENLEKKE